MANFNWAQMLFDEPMATQGFRTTGNDPLNQFASWYQFGQNLRKGAEARRAQREAQEMARAEAQKYGNSNPQQGAIGADANGVYGMPMQQSVGVGADANGVYGAGQPTTGSYGNFTGQIPNSPYPVNNNQMPTQSDFGKALGNQGEGTSLGDILTTSGLDLLSGKKGGNTLGSMFSGGSLANFLNPVSSVDSAQVDGGATNLSADNPFARSSRYLGADYDKMAYVKSALDNGVKNPLVAMAMYDQMIAPLREAAKVDELRNAFFVLRNADPNSKEYNDAVSLIQYYKKDPYMKENHDMNVERFGWAKQNQQNQQALFPYRLQNAQLGLEGQRLGLEGKRLALQNRQNGLRVGDILRGFTGQFFPIEKSGNYEDSDLSKTRKDLVTAADILNTYSRNKFGKALSVNGGWRSEGHNASVNGSSSSHHLTGHAMDIDASKLSEAELADLQGFAKALGLNADGDDMYHDKGSGYHMHITLPKGYYLKPVDLGNGKYLTPDMMRGVNGNNNDPFDAQTYNQAAFLWGGGTDGKSKPNAELAKVLATKFVKDYRDALKKNGGNPQRAINAVQEIIKKDKQIAGPIEENPMFDKLIFSIANEAALIANGQGGQDVQMPTEQSQTIKTDKPTNLGGWGAKVGNDNPPDRSKRDKSLDAIDNAELDENRIGMYNLDGYGQVPDSQDLNRNIGNRSYYESLLKYFGSGT